MRLDVVVWRSTLCLLLTLCPGEFGRSGALAAQNSAAVAEQGNVDAQHGHKRGLELGLGLKANLVHAGRGGGRSAGAGLVLRAGYSFHERAGIHLRGAFAAMGADNTRTDGFGMGYWDIAVRLKDNAIPLPNAG
jgi:hypothetical protein